MNSRGLKKSELAADTLTRFISCISPGHGENDCWVWMGCFRNKGRYGQLGAAGWYPGAHVVSYAMFRGDVPTGVCVLHRCDNMSCVNPKHLFLGTKADNVHDAMNKGRWKNPKGEKNGRARLTEQSVREIRSLCVTKKFYTYAQMAAIHKVAVVTIAKICQGKLWRHVA